MDKLEKLIYDASSEYERKVFDEGRLSDERERAKIIAAAVLPLIEKAFEAGERYNRFGNCEADKKENLKSLDNIIGKWPGDESLDELLKET
jgi:hypothetical protein